MNAKPQSRSEKMKVLSSHFPQWEKTKDCIDQYIDIILNYRQSGHPGGSRSKVHLLLSLMLSGEMRWDIRRPDKRFSDKFVLGAGHTIPLIYSSLAVLNEAMRARAEETGDEKFRIYKEDERALYWEDLLGFRRRGGLSGHAEAEGKTLFLKTNTGPSGHGTPAAAGLALGLKRAAAKGVKVFIVEGEGGLTPGATHETLNSAWGLALDNLYFLVDWNDFGIDDHSLSTVVYGTPEDWFGSHGWWVTGTEKGSEWETVTDTLLALCEHGQGQNNPNRCPQAAWFKTRKGRGYYKYDNASHGAPHKMNSELFWKTKKEFAENYGAEFVNVDGEAPASGQALEEEFRANLEAVAKVIRSDRELVRCLSDSLVEIGDSVPESIEGFRLGTKGPKKSPFEDKRLYDFANYPEDIYKKPGETAANRNALASWGSWINSFCAKEYGRPAVMAASADLAGSTNIKGFADGYGGFEGYGWYERKGNDEGTLLPQAITEFSNAGILASMASLNLSDEPEKSFDGFWGAASTYGSFSYLKYGPLRLFSQMSQDTDLKMGKFIWVAGHSGPETADDSRTHFGIFSPGVTQLFPKGRCIDLHPWEYNEVPVLLAAALSQETSLVALHLTRPSVEIPDRKRLGMASHFEAAKGAYIVRDYKAGMPKAGTFFVQGTSAMTSIVELLARFDEENLNVKIVYTASAQLFALQPQEYRNRIVSPADRADSTIITTQAKRLMHDWIFNPLAEEYALSADFDDRWRTGGTLDEVIEEAHLSPEYIWRGIRRFAEARPSRLAQLKGDLEAAEK